MESTEPDFDEAKPTEAAETTPPVEESPPPPISSSEPGVEDVPKLVDITPEPPTTTKQTEGSINLAVTC